MYTTRSNQQFNYRQSQNSQNPRRNYHSLYCDFCNMKGHDRTDCNKLKKCDNCHSTGHVKDYCYLLIRYPDNFKGKKKVNVVGREGAQLQEAQDYAASGGSAMYSKLHNVQVQVDRKGSGQADAPEQWLQMLHKASPK
ncbi:hypothetical protein H5410_058045 [Solanum commersonii]|uniref:Uncharacterized protein n=1 Tax=Solanum commersonii TaxID=4109 RepID=A0A9J5WRP7_SOLCO|nr:hypothetical protein H5410_058045 [Solanum commersonii]